MGYLLSTKKTQQRSKCNFPCKLNVLFFTEHLSEVRLYDFEGFIRSRPFQIFVIAAVYAIALGDG